MPPGTSPVWPSNRRRPPHPHRAAARDRRPRRPALPGLGPRRRRALPGDLARPARLLLDEHGDHARLPVPLQLVRQADLGPALPRPLAGERGRRDARGLAGTYRPDHLWFADDIFGLKPGWIERFADALAAEGLRIPFKCLHRADLLVRGDTAEALARAGARTVWMGAESGSQRILDAMEKGTTVEQIDEAARRLRAAGIEVCFFLQFGYPGENREDIEATLAMVRAIAARRHRHVGVLSAARHALLRARSRPSSATSRTGSTRPTSPCSIAAPSRRRSTGSSTPCCTPSSGPAAEPAVWSRRSAIR